MKKIIILLVFAIVLSACKKDDNQRSDNTVLIKGKIETGLKAGNTMSGLSLEDARRVVVFSGERYSIVEIENNSFSLEASVGSATALIFVDEGNRYIGNLTVSGLNILPLVNLSDGDNTVIDLSTLTLFETSVVPANNPIGKEIMITDDEIEMLREIGSYFEAIAKNIDTDNDGVLDNFTGKQLSINSGFNVIAGTLGTNNSPAILKNINSLEINYGVRIAGFKALVPAVLAASFSGPAGAPHTDIVASGYNYSDHCECFDAFFRRQTPQQMPGDQVQPAFNKGVYSFTLDGINNHTLYFSSISAKYFLLLAVPVIKTENNGIITNVEIQFMLPDGTPVDHTKFITTMMLMFKNTGSNIVHQEGAIFDLMNRLPDFENVSVSKQMNINEITQVEIGYTDLVGNIYSIAWNK